jgi:hypothetical protein
MQIATRSAYAFLVISVALSITSLYLSASSADAAVPTSRSVVATMYYQALLIFGLGLVQITHLPQILLDSDGWPWLTFIPFPIYAATPLVWLLRKWTARARFLVYTGALLMCTLYWLPYARLDGTGYDWLPWDRPFFAYVEALSLVAMSAAWVLYRPVTWRSPSPN